MPKSPEDYIKQVADQGERLKRLQAEVKSYLPHVTLRVRAG